MKGTLVVDVTTVPRELDLAGFFILLKQEGVCFYNSKQNPEALPPYGILGDTTDTAILDIADDKVRAKFELALLTLNEAEVSNSENEDI